MPTEKPRVTITMSKKELEIIENFRFKNRIKNQTQAILFLINRGLQTITSEGTLERSLEASPQLEEARQLSEIYMRLDQWGQRLLWSTAQHEFARRQNEDQLFRDIKPTPKVISLFLKPDAVGAAFEENGQLCEPYELRIQDPQNASYAIRIQGDDLEPDFPDGSIAFVCYEKMEDGDIGVFHTNGATVIKQWHTDPTKEIIYLFSLNRARADTDLIIRGKHSVVWQGKIITKKQYLLPEL